MAELEKDDWLDDPIDSPGDQDVVASDQSNLDSTVLFDAPTAASSAMEPEPSLGAELDQSSIDALFSQVDEPLSSPPQQAAAAETIDLGQSEIDDLLASPQKPAAEQAISDPDQDEIDKLFSDMGGASGGESDNPFLEEESAFKEDSQQGQESSPQSANLDFGGDDFKFDADIPHIPDTVSSPAVPETDFSSQTFGEETVVASPPAEAPAPTAPVAAKVASSSGEAKKGGLVLALRQLVAHRKLLVGGAAGVALLLLTTTVLLWRGGQPQIAETTTSTTAVPAEKEEAPAAPTAQTTEGQHQPTEPASAPAEPEPPKESSASPPSPPMNGRPTVESMELAMPPENSQMLITLRGSDPENEPLEYEFQSMPEHGQLSGHAPNLIYTPRPDFSGSDRFAVTATDGKNKSIPASITINRATPVVVKEPPPVKAEVEVGVAEKKAPVFSTAKTGAKRAKPRVVAHRAEVSEPGHHPAPVNRAPVIHLQPLAHRYATADTCVLNASQTSDEHRETVTFHWQQLAGEPVVLKSVSRDHAQVNFVVPASFSTVSDPTLQFLVTATDQEGATDAKEVTVVTQSRRHSALWQGRP